MKRKEHKAMLHCLLTAILITSPLSVVYYNGLTVYAEEAVSGKLGEQGNVFWSFNEDTGTLSITGQGDPGVDFLSISDRPWARFNDKITKIVMDEGVQPKTMQGWFKDLTNLKDLSDFKIPDSMEDLVTLFSGCESLESLPTGFTIPANVTNIHNMFNGCINLKSLSEGFTIPSSATNVSYMFSDCSSLNSLPAGFIIPDSVTNSSYMFQNCGSLVELPENFNFSQNTQDMSYMFDGCSSLSVIPEGAEIPDSVNITGFISQNNPIYRKDELSASLQSVLAKNPIAYKIEFSFDGIHFDEVRYIGKNKWLIYTYSNKAGHNFQVGWDMKATIVDSDIYNYEIGKVNSEGNVVIHGVLKAVSSDTSSTSSRNGWYKIKNQWVYFIHDKKAEGFTTINKKDYYFIEGIPQTNQWIEVDDKTYYADSAGEIVKGWLTLADDVYYLDEKDGHRYQDWAYLEDQWFYFDSQSGHLLKHHWVSDRHHDWYYLDVEGKMSVSCWLASSNGRWYYLGSDGKMVKNQWIDGCLINAEGFYISPLFKA
ncbi:BspA family leucine-rich repeat surface protein [Dielma fastidiosa]|uniref:BspA family leucine-rich repeat surface protein n=1 Tax=Dielma fastidiosa TaxID=1034346 RepID=UPI0035650B8C